MNNNYLPLCTYSGDINNLNTIKSKYPSATVLKDTEGYECIYVNQIDYVKHEETMKKAMALDSMMSR